MDQQKPMEQENYVKKDLRKLFFIVLGILILLLILFFVDQKTNILGKFAEQLMSKILSK